MPLLAYKGKKPQLNPGAFIMNSATLIGEVMVGDRVLILSNAVLRGDFNGINIGEEVVVQENAVLNPTFEVPIVIEGSNTIGYGARIHGAEIGKGAFIGTNSVILPGARIGADSLIAAGSIVKENFVVPPGTLVAGVPARVVRELTAEGIAWLRQSITINMAVLEEYQKTLQDWEIRHCPAR